MPCFLSAIKLKARHKDVKQLRVCVADKGVSVQLMYKQPEQLINQMIFYGGQGVFFDKDTRLHISADKSFVIHPEFVDDFENEDYNNAFYNVTVIEEE